MLSRSRPHLNEETHPPLVSLLADARLVDRFRLGNLLVSPARLVLAISPRRDLYSSLV